MSFTTLKVAYSSEKEPQQLVQVILGCSFGKPAELGYDISMSLWRGRALKPLPSYDPQIKLEEYKRKSVEKLWLIRMPNEGNTQELIEFVTIKAISIVHAESMSGRATVVWAVVKREDLDKPNRQVHASSSKQAFDGLTKVDICSETDMARRNSHPGTRTDPRGYREYQSNLLLL
jgi:hypothetical protein